MNKNRKTNVSAVGCYTSDQMVSAIRQAFENGKLWGETYQGWFQPTEGQHGEKLAACVREIASQYKTKVSHDQNGKPKL